MSSGRKKTRDAGSRRGEGDPSLDDKGYKPTCITNCAMITILTMFILHTNEI